jgi:dynein assembly factor 1, axonemal
MEMTKEYLKKLCKQDNLYTTPSINDKLYLHYKGFSEVKNLDEYIGLKVLWLEGNGLNKISGLEHQTLLRTLYLHENIIERMENLENQTDLDTLNLSKNFIKRIENIGHMKKLTNLNMAHNKLASADDLLELLELPALQSIDLQQNKIEDPNIVDILAQIPDLRVIYLMGNPCVKLIRNYRKTIVSRCKALKYLDDRPVFEEERRRTDAWARVLEAGGSLDEANEAERNELKLIRQEKDDADERNFRAFEQLMKEGQEIRRLKELEKQQAFDGIETNIFSGEAIISVPESELLRIAREQRWGVNCDSVASLPPPHPAPESLPTTVVTAGTKIAIELVDDGESDKNDEVEVDDDDNAAVEIARKVEEVVSVDIERTMFDLLPPLPPMEEPRSKSPVVPKPTESEFYELD